MNMNGVLLLSELTSSWYNNYQPVFINIIRYESVNFVLRTT